MGEPNTVWAGSAIRRIAVVRALPGLGDFLVAVPAWRALRGAFPDARISLIGLPETSDLVRRFGAYLDDLLEFPGFPGIKERPPDARRLTVFLQHAQAERFDLALQMHGNGVYSNLFTMLLGATKAAGYFLSDQYRPDARTFMPYPAEAPEVCRYLQLLELLGLPHQGPALEFPLETGDSQRLTRLQEKYGLQPGKYVCVHPGANQAARRWSPTDFGVVAAALHRRGLQVVLTGTHGEKDLTRAVQRSMRRPAIDLAGQTELGTLAALIHHARLVISNDTGVSHLADAVGTASVVIFLRPDAELWAPLDHDRHRIVRGDEARGRPPASATNGSSVSATLDEVLVAAGALLERGKPEATHA